MKPLFLKLSKKKIERKKNLCSFFSNMKMRIYVIICASLMVLFFYLFNNILGNEMNKKMEELDAKNDLIEKLKKSEQVKQIELEKMTEKNKKIKTKLNNFKINLKEEKENVLTFKRENFELKGKLEEYLKEIEKLNVTLKEIETQREQEKENQEKLEKEEKQKKQQKKQKRKNEYDEEEEEEEIPQSKETKKPEEIQKKKLEDLEIKFFKNNIIHTSKSFYHPHFSMLVHNKKVDKDISGSLIEKGYWGKQHSDFIHDLYKMNKDENRTIFIDIGANIGFFFFV